MQKQFHANISQYIEDPGVESIGVINKHGRITEFDGTNNIPLSDSNKEMFFMKIALRASMQKDFDEELDKVDYCITKRDSKKYISIPTFDDNTILVVTHKDVNHEKIIEEIIHTIKHSEQFLEMPITNGGKA